MPRKKDGGRSEGRGKRGRRSSQAFWVVLASLCVEGASAQTIRWLPAGAAGPAEIRENHIVVPPGATLVTFELTLAGWGQASESPQLGSYQATVDSAGYANGVGDPLTPLGWPDSPGDGAFIARQICSLSGAPCAGSGSCDESDGACLPNPRFVFTHSVPITLISTATLDYQWGAGATDGCKADDGQSYYGGTLVLEVPPGARGLYTIGFDTGETNTFLNDCSNSQIPDLSTVAALLTVLTADDCILDGPTTSCRGDCDDNGVCDLCEIADGSLADCNGNSVPDVCDLDEGVSVDCNGNSVPDECEVDCNGNGVHDDCDIASGLSDDCNDNDMPDECEPDCQPNGTADECDLLFGSSADCNGNGVPDECEPDCQPNGLADECDLLFGLSTDCDDNGTPDECDDDCDGNGIADACETPTTPRIAWRPKRAEGPFSLCGNEILLSPGDGRIELELIVSGWGLAPGGPTLGAYQATLDASRLEGGHPDNLAQGTTAGVDLQPIVGVHGQADAVFIALRTCSSTEDFSSTGQRCDTIFPPLPPCNPDEICLPNPDFVFSGTLQTTLVSPTQLFWGAVTIPGLCRVDEDPDGYYAGTLILEVPAEATGTYTVGFDPGQSSTFLNDCSGSSIPEVDLVPARIRLAWCGDGLIELEEQCDDANSEGRDGCSASCTVEETWECGGTPSVCTTLCGNGIENPGEDCDDGNRRDGDGCSAACRVEAQCALAELTTGNGNANDWFGVSVSISGDHAIAGSPNFDGNGANSGTAYVFVRDSESWSFQAGLQGSATAAGENFGSAVALRGDRAVVGSPGGGAGYVFERVGTSWIERARLLPPDLLQNDGFGTAVALDGDHVVIGAPRDDDACAEDPGCDSGTAHVFRLDPEGWVHEATLIASDAEADELFGTSVAIHGDVIAVGAHWDNKRGARSGSVYLFRWDGLAWAEETVLTASDGTAQDQFGRAVSLDENLLVVGSWFDDESESNTGSAYVFAFDGSSWVEEAKLLASEARASDNFGAAVGIDGDLVVVGAPGNDDACDGVTTCNSGSAYVFRREGPGWIQAALIKAGNVAAGDRFGWSVAIDEGVALIGARDADRAGDANRGAAYLFAVGGDCNDNTIPDICDLATGLRPDCNGNDIPDDCDPDGDEDGVPDDCDLCPGGDDGLDSDGDGVADFCDPCPADHPDDTDGDGVCDGYDACPGGDDTIDGDGDGVPDDCDVCSGGDDGLDGDGDGVADFCDPCPADSPDDSDGDGVCDSDDACPGHDDAEDCDADGLPNGCEADCQPNGIADDCEILAGTSPDVNENEIPDECEPGSCCHGDGTCIESLEAACMTGVWSLDGVCAPNTCPQRGACCSPERLCTLVLESECDSGIWSPDETCTFNPCLQPPLPAAYPHDRTKNRYISFDPNPANAGAAVAIRVELTSVDMGSCNGSGAPCRLERGGTDCGRCSVSGDPCITAAINCNPPGQSCDPTGETCVHDHAGSIGRSWWVGPESPSGSGVHLLVNESLRVVRADWPSIVHIGDCEIVPAATYTVRLVDVDHAFKSEVLEVMTIQRPGALYWADVGGTLSHFCGGDSRAAACEPDGDPCTGGQACLPAWPPPDGAVDFDDILAVVFAFEKKPFQTQPHMTWVDIQGADRGAAVVDPPDLTANLADVQFLVLAFEGFPYPFSDPADCPDVSVWP